MTSGIVASVGDRQGVGEARIDALDGLRALAVVAVLLFHLDLNWMSGGFLGVSLFFTLSGFLITRLLLEESRSTGRVALGAFWSRRLRRLSPASIVVLGAIVVLSLVGVFEGTRLRGDVAASLGYSANWRFATAGTTYADMFTSTPSPVIHFWSLAIEEQFYVLFPLIFVVLARRRAVLVGGLLTLSGASLIATFLTDSRNLGYYGTHLRAAELLVGALLAVCMEGRTFSNENRVLRLLGPVTLFGALALMVSASPSDDWLYRGGFVAMACLSALLIASLCASGPLARFFGLAPVVAVGRASYSIYLVHWPLIVLMNPERMGFDGWSLDALRALTSIAVGFLSYVIVENPVRRRRILKRGVVAGATLLVGILSIAVATIFVPSTSETMAAGLDAPDEIVDFADTEQTTPGVATTMAPAPPRVLVIGSTSIPEEARAFDGADYELIDVTQSDCPVLVTTAPGAPCRSLSEILRSTEARSSSAIVLVMGSAERRYVDDQANTNSDDVSSTTVAPEIRAIQEAAEYVDRTLLALPEIPVIVLDSGPADAVRAAIDDADLRLDHVTSMTATDPSVADRIRESVAGHSSEQRNTSVVVIGDSSSFGLAQALHDVAGSEFDVVWAGGRNCPLVDVERIQWWPDMEFEMEKCPTYDAVWKKLLEEKRPSLVLHIASVPEQSGQQYAGDPTWYIVDDQEFIDRHDAVMTELMDTIDSVGATLVMFDSPYVRVGSFSGAVFAQDERVDAWNALMNRWAERWPQIRRLDWSGILDVAEPTPGALRVDGVHLEQTDLNRIVADSVVPRLREVLAEREMSATSVP
ncbi:MAG: acyltransferase [Acidimicrobiia bacterium]|nr:acyltransferase [Acidimicrobiia bacterium]